MLKNQTSFSLLLFFILSFFNSHAQATKTKMKDMTDNHGLIENILGQIDGETYVIEEYGIHKFDKNMKTVFVKDLFKREKRTKFTYYCGSLILNKKVVVFGFKDMAKKRITSAYFYDKNGDPEENPIIVDTRVDMGGKTSTPIVTASPDGSKIMVLSYTYVKDKIATEVNINVFDASLKPIWNKTNITFGKDKTYSFADAKREPMDENYMQKYSVDNNGNAHIIALVKKKKESQYAAILSFGNSQSSAEDSGDEGSVNEWPVGTKGGEGYYDFMIKSGPDGSTICTGLYLINNIEAGLYYCMIDGSENKIKISQYIPFNEEISKQVAEKVYSKKSSGFPGIPSLKRGNFLPVYAIGRKNGGYYLVFELTGIMNGIVASHNSLITSSISSKGALEWTNFVFKFCATKLITTATGAFETKEGKLMICYNDVKSNANTTDESKMNTTAWNYESCVLKVLTYDETGKYTTKIPVTYEGNHVEPLIGKSFLTENQTLIFGAIEYDNMIKSHNYKIGMVKLNE